MNSIDKKIVVVKFILTFIEACSIKIPVMTRNNENNISLSILSSQATSRLAFTIPDPRPVRGCWGMP
jgi:hypothetical protein